MHRQPASCYMTTDQSKSEYKNRDFLQGDAGMSGSPGFQGARGNSGTDGSPGPSGGKGDVVSI